MKGKKNPETFGGKWRYLFMILALVFSVGVSAQKTVVKGNILDRDNLPVIGANILEKGTTNGTISDVDGNFTITVSSPKAVLLIKYIGYKDVEKAVSPMMKIVMEEDSEMLEDVVVIGYGSVKKSDATGSVTAIKPDDFNKGLRTTAQDALVGKVPGVNVVASSGAPGAGATIRIRSGASLSASNDPLIVVDGVPVDNSTIEGGGNVIGGINPNDIETFTVLKDASATAIYGSRASNGVIVITTKKGSDSNLRFNYSTNLSVSTITEKLDVLSADEFREFVPTVSGVPGSVTLGTASTDWQDEIYRTAFGQEHNFSVSGKVKKNAPYRLSVGYNNQNGVVKTNNYERFTFNGGISPKFFDNHLTVDLNVKVSYEDNQKVDESVVNNALRYDPTRPVMTGSATGADEPGLGYFIWMNGNSPMAIQTDNPVAQLELQDLHNKVTRSIGNAAINYKVHRLEDLQLNANLGYDVLKSKYTKNVPDMAGMMYTSNMKDGTGLVYDSKQNKRNYLLDLYANYAHVFNEKHNFSAMAGYGWQHFWKKFDATTLSPEGKELFSPNHYESEYYLLSFYGRLNYSYDNRYMITATLRSDASSRFAKDNRWGLFPSVALGWKMNEEAFLKKFKDLSELKLRLGWGITGQQDIQQGDYPYMSFWRYGQGGAMYPIYDESGNVKWVNVVSPSASSPDLKWEQTTTYNVGIDYGFFNNRINGSADFYIRDTKDLINAEVNVPAGTDFAEYVVANIGSLKNTGFEFAINAKPIVSSTWNWDLGFNVAWNKTEITKLDYNDNSDSPGKRFESTGGDGGKTIKIHSVGYAPGTYYVFEQVYDKNGNPMEGVYVDRNGDGEVTEKDLYQYHKPTADVIMGFNSKVSYKNWDFGFNGRASIGNYNYNGIAANAAIGTSAIFSNSALSNQPKAAFNTNFQERQRQSDYYIQNASFLKIDNITLGYSFENFLQGAKYHGLSGRLYATVQNPITITPYDGLDPEVDGGMDRQVYPRPISVLFGVNINF